MDDMRVWVQKEDFYLFLSLSTSLSIHFSLLGERVVHVRAFAMFLNKNKLSISICNLEVWFPMVDMRVRVQEENLALCVRAPHLALNLIKLNEI